MSKAKAKPPARWREVPLDDLPDRDDGWTYADPQMALKLQASLRRHGQFRAVLVATVDGGLRVLDGRRIVAAMRTLGWKACTVCDLGETAPDTAAVAALAAELKFETDYARLSQAVHRLHGEGVTLERLASAGPWSEERVGYLDTLATFDWSQFAEASDDGQASMDWDADDIVAPPATAMPGPCRCSDAAWAVDCPQHGRSPERDAAPLGPDSFGGSDEGSHYMAQTKAADLVPSVLTAEAVAGGVKFETVGAAPPAAPAKGKAKKPAAPPGPSLFDDIDGVA